MAKLVSSLITLICFLSFSLAISLAVPSSSPLASQKGKAGNDTASYEVDSTEEAQGKSPSASLPSQQAPEEEDPQPEAQDFFAGLDSSNHLLKPGSDADVWVVLDDSRQSQCYFTPPCPPEETNA